MSVPGTGWGYDKDIAESLSEIAEHLGRLVNHFVDEEEISKESVRRSVAASCLGTVSGFADWLQEAIDTDNAFKKAVKFRDILTRANELRVVYQKELDEVGDNGEAEQVQKAVKKDPEERQVESKRR